MLFACCGATCLSVSALVVIVNVESSTSTPTSSALLTADDIATSYTS